MDCNTQIHDELKYMEESSCPFCDLQLVEVDKVVEPCCSEQNMETINGMNACVNCGLVYGYNYVREFVDFYTNMYMIRQKSVYHRKYHIENVLNSILCENYIQLTYNQREKIYKIFAKIDGVLNEINDKRKRIISIKFILKQLFKMLGLPYKCINVTKLKRTLTSYEQYWEKVQSLIGNEIQLMINV